MKFVQSIRLLILLTLLSAPFLAGAEEPKTALSLSARTTKTDSAKGHYDCQAHQTTRQATTIEIALMNLSKANTLANVEWFFVGIRTDTNDKVSFSRGTNSLSLKSGATQAFEAKSGMLYLHDARCMRFRQTDATMLGYIVRATTPDGTVKYFANPAPLTDCIASEAAFKKFLKDSADWEKERSTTIHIMQTVSTPLP